MLMAKKNQSRLLKRLWQKLKKLNNKENYQDYKKRFHEPGRTFEISYEEFLETNTIACNHHSLPKKLTEAENPEDLYIQKEDSCIQKSRSEALREALDKLHEKQRGRFLMYYLDGLTLKYIAELESCYTNAIKKSFDAAKKKLKEFLSNFWF